MWAPGDNGKWANVLNGLLKIQREGVHAFEMKFVIPFDPIPGVEDVETLTELWFNPCLLNKYKSIVRAAVFYKQAMRCVFTGQAGPMHNLKSLLIVRCSSNAESIPPTIMSWKTNLLNRNLGYALTVDVSASGLEEARCALEKLSLEGLAGWEPPRRSPASNPDRPRLVIRGFVDPSMATALDLALMVKVLRTTPGMEQCLVGSSVLVGDCSALVVEFGDVSVIDSTCNKAIQEILVISNRKALMTTLQAKQVWEGLLTQQMESRPLDAITVIRMRQSLGLKNSVWVKPLMVEDQVRSKKKQGALARLPSDEQIQAALQAELRIEGMPNTSHMQACEELINKVTEVTGVQLTKATSDKPGVGEWFPCYKNGGDFAQRIAVQLPSSEALKNVIQKINGSGIRVGGFDLGVEVLSMHPGFSAASTEGSNYVFPHVGPGGTCL